MSRKKKQTKTLEELLAEALVPEEEQPYELPENWVWVRLGVLDSGAKSRSIDPRKYPDETFELYSVPSFPQFPEIVKGSDIGSSKQKVEENDVLLCKINPRINRVWIVNIKKDNKQIASTEWIVITPGKNVNPKYLLWGLRSPYFRNLLTSNVSGVGGSLTRARPKEVMTYTFPLPPLSEQKRIVDRVESLLGKIDEAKGLIQEAQESFEQRRAALLDRAFRGELTRTWREQHPDMEPADRLLERIREEKASMEIQKGRRKKAADLSPIDPPYELPEGWKWVRLGELTESTGYGTSAKANDDTTGVPVLRMGNIQHGELESDNLRYLPPDHPDVQKYQLEEDDLLFNRTNSYELVGKTAIVRAQQAGKMTYASYLVRVRLHKKNVLAQYICNYINSAIGREYLLSTVTQQVGQANINASKLIGLPVPVPPEDELKEIKSTLESIFVLAEQADEYLEVNLSTLIQSILTQAFRGELGTHDPAEESALELLKRTLADQNGLDYESPVRETLQVAEQGELYLT